MSFFLLTTFFSRKFMNDWNFTNYISDMIDVISLTDSRGVVILDECVQMNINVLLVLPTKA